MTLANPLLCARCGRPMRISFIDDPPVIRKILLHLKLWDLPQCSPPEARPAKIIYDPELLAGLND